MTEMIIPDLEMDYETSIPLEYESELRAAFQAELSDIRAELEINDKYISIRQQRMQELADVNGWNLQPLQEYSAQVSELSDEIDRTIDQRLSETMFDRENRFQTLMAQKQKLVELEAELAAPQTSKKEGYIFDPPGYTVARTGKTVFMHNLLDNKLYLWCIAYIDPQDGLSIPYSALDTSFIFKFVPPITGYYRFQSTLILEGCYVLFADSWELSQALAGATLSTWFQVEQNGLLPRQVRPRLKLYDSEYNISCLTKQFYYTYDTIYAAVLQKDILTRIHIGVKLETLARGFTPTGQGSVARWEFLPTSGYFCVPWVHYRV